MVSAHVKRAAESFSDIAKVCSRALNWNGNWTQVDLGLLALLCIEG